MTHFYKSETYCIVKAMKATGNRTGIVAQWKKSLEAWAKNVEASEAEALRAWLPLWQVRPAYTAAELVPLWPALSIALGFTLRSSARKSVARLTNELKFAGLPFRHINGKEYFIVERCHYWREAEEKELYDAIFNG